MRRRPGGVSPLATMPFVTALAAVLVGTIAVLDLVVHRRLRRFYPGAEPARRPNLRRWVWKSQYRSLGDIHLNRLMLVEKLLAVAVGALVIGAYLFHWYLNYRTQSGRP